MATTDHGSQLKRKNVIFLIKWLVYRDPWLDHGSQLNKKG